MYRDFVIAGQLRLTLAYILVCFGSENVKCNKNWVNTKKEHKIPLHVTMKMYVCFFSLTVEQTKAN